MDNIKQAIKKKRIPKCVLPPDIDSLVFLAYRGSKSFGTYQKPTDPNSIDDIDLIGCYVNPIEGYLGFPKSVPLHYELKHGKWDCIHYEFRKMIGLLAKGNPNVLASLWLPYKHIIYLSPMWNEVIRHRDLFTSRVVYSAFCGYANDQLKKMTHFTFKGYMGPKRRMLVKRHGYDTKNAAHLIRLLTMGIEFLRYKRLCVDRAGIDKDELLRIKNGVYPLAVIKRNAEALFKIGNGFLKDSNLPKNNDMAKIENMMVKLLIGELGI